jgi:PPP family 3-phenylpropionic acid transporter
MVIALLLACILQAISHGAYYTFFSIFLEDQGYSRSFVGWMWALGVLAEVILFIFVYRLFDRFEAYQLFAVSLLITALRWVLLAEFADYTTVLWLSQLLHAASFGLFHASAIHLIHDWFPGSLQGRGQALYAGLSFGLGGAIGSVLSGYLWELTTAATSFLTMSAIAFVGWLISITLIKKSTLWDTKEHARNT